MRPFLNGRTRPFLGDVLQAKTPIPWAQLCYPSPQVAPMFAGELVEGDPPVPVMRETLHRLRSELAVARVELGPQLLARRLALRIGHRTQECAGLGALFFRDRIQHVGDPMPPAPLLGGRRLLLG